MVTEPTCTEQGYTKHTCHCGDSYVDSKVEALGHTPSDWIVDVEPSIGEQGSRHKECTLCGETLETEIMEALTEAPTTEPPTTEPPTTEPPTTEGETTETESPTTQPDFETEENTSELTTPDSDSETETEPEDPDSCKTMIGAPVALIALLGCMAVAWRPRKRG